MSSRFSEKSILVTGASSGIGRATALLFAAEGARVFAVDVTGEVETLAQEHRGIQTAQGDAAKEQDVEKIIEQCCERNGGLDAIVANAGISGGFEGMFNQTAQDFAEVLRVNLIGPCPASALVRQI